MELPLDKVTSSEVAKRFGFYYDEAMTHPIAVERNGASRVVMMSATEYERLARLDHIALSPTELSNDALRAIMTAEPTQKSYDANKLLD